MSRPWLAKLNNANGKTRYRSALLAIGLFCVGAVGLLVSAAQPATAAAGINSTVNFQGRLLNAAGAVVADGNYNIQFKIYQDGPGNVAGDTGGTLMWTESWVYGVNTPDNRVTVKNGYFSVPLGTICPMTATTCTGSTGNSQTNTVVDFNQDTLWLSMNVGNTTTAASFASAAGDGEMLPMRRLSSSVYALNAGKLGGLSSAGFIQNVSTAATQQTANINILSGTATNVAAAQIQTVASATAPVLILKGGASPGAGADLLQLQNSSGTVLFRADSSGVLGSADLSGATAGTTLRTGNSSSAGTGVLTLSTGNASGGNSGNIVINTGTASGTKGSITIGATSGAVANVINIGTNAAASSTNVIHIGDGATNPVNTITVGSLVSTSETTIQGGTGATAINLAAGASGNINIGVNAVTGKVINIGSVGSTANVSTIHIADSTGAANQNVTIGATNNAGNTVAIQGGTGTAVSLAAASTGTIQVGATSVANTITIGNTSGAVTEVINIGTNAVASAVNNIHIGDGAANPVNTITIGSLVGSSTTTLQAGTGNINLTTNQATAGTIVKTATNNSTTAFQIQNAAGTTFFAADSVNQIISTKDLNVGSAANRSTSRLFSDGFESGNFGLWSGGTSAAGTSTITADTTIVRNGKYSAKITNNSSAVTALTSLNAGTTVTARAYVYVSSQPTGQSTFFVLKRTSGTNPWIEVMRNAAGNLQVYNDPNGTAYGSTAMSTGAWHEVEVVATIANPAGSIQLYLDGAQVVNQTGISTGSLAPDQLSLGDGFSGNTATYYIDDLVIDSVRPGDSSSLNVNDSLHIAGTSTFGAVALFGGVVNLGTASAANGTLVVNNSTNANAVTIVSGATSASYQLTLPTAVGATGDCLKGGTLSGSTLPLTFGSCGAGGGGVTLQGSTPGTPDTGNFNISGTGIAATLQAATVNLGTASASNGTIVVRNSSNSNTLTLVTGVTSSSYTLTLPTAVGATGDCLKGGTLAGSTLPLTFGSCGGGGGGTTQTRILSPEYAGATISADGSSNSGTLTSDFDRTNNRNYYEWSNTTGTLNDYDIVVRTAIPSDYASGFGTLRFYALTTDTTPTTAEEDIVVTVKDGSGTSCATTVSVLPGTGNTWTQSSSITLSGCTFSANSVLTIIIQLKSLSSNIVRISDLSYQYTN